MSDIHNLLLSRFFHDIASPISALSLLLEMLEDKSNAKDIKMAQQCCDNISDLLCLYRILLPYQDKPKETFPGSEGLEIFERSIDYIQKISKKEGVSFENHIAARQIDDLVGKMILCIFTLLRGVMRPLRSFIISESVVENGAITLELDITSQETKSAGELTDFIAFFDNIEEASKKSPAPHNPKRFFASADKVAYKSNQAMYILLEQLFDDIFKNHLLSPFSGSGALGGSLSYNQSGVNIKLSGVLKS